jgi:hypothetical protein
MKWPGRGSVHPSARTLLRLFKVSGGATAELDQIARDIGRCGWSGDRAITGAGRADTMGDILGLLWSARLLPP